MYTNFIKGSTNSKSMVEFMGIRISPQDIAEGLTLLSSYLNKDRNSICLILNLTNQNIQDWHAEITSFVATHTAKQLTQRGPMSVDSVRAIFEATLSPYRKSAAAQSVYILENIETLYNSRKLGFLTQDAVERMAQIRYLINGEQPGSGNLDWVKDNASTPEEEQSLRKGFMYLARNDSDVTNLGRILEGSGGIQNAQELMRWLDTLEKLRFLIMDLVTKILFSLNCQQEGIEALRRQVIGKNSDDGK